MKHVPMCNWCDEAEVQIVTDSDGSGYCSPECENGQWKHEQAEYERRREFPDIPEYDDDYISRYDNDPNVYDGNYSEE